MKEFNNIKIVGVDYGYGNIKTAGTVTKSGVTAYETEPIFSGNILEYEGGYYRIGECQKEFVSDKVSDDDYYLLTLMSIARELNVYGIHEADVHLAAGLPLTWIRRQREEFRSYLLKNREVTYRFNGKEYRIRLIGCSLYPQGYPAIVTRLKDFKGTNLLADIGKPYLDCITSAARQYVADIFSTLHKYEYNPDLMRLYIVGGGGCLIRHFGQYDESRVTIVDDICATAKGYEYLAFSSLRRKG